MLQKISVIYNPKSTGKGKKRADAFVAELKKHAPDLAVTAIQTTHANHAYELALEHAGTDTVIISSSGDGGFNEVVRGVLASSHPKTIVGVLPAGNANDHYHFRQRGNVAQRIADNDYDIVDVIQVELPDKTLHAHSYVGIGMTADIGDVLSKTKLNPVREVWLVFTHMLKRRAVKIRVDGHERSYDSVIFSVIGRMSKYFQVGSRKRPYDGTFDITRLHDGSLNHLMRHLIRHTIQAVDNAPSQKTYTFTALQSFKLQCDGEIHPVKKDSTVTVTCLPGALRTIV